MSETVKLIIEIPKDFYEITKAKVDKNMTYALYATSVANGIPLDDVKAEIKRMEYHMIDCDVLVSQEEVLEIIDKHISGEGDKEC